MEKSSSYQHQKPALSVILRGLTVEVWGFYEERAATKVLLAGGALNGRRGG